VLNLLKPLPDTIPGGEIIRDPGMGVLCDSALTLVENIFPKKTEEERMKALKVVVRELHSVGLVGVHEAGVFPENIRMYKKYPPLSIPCPCPHSFPQILYPCPLKGVFRSCVHEVVFMKLCS
jgi:predicted amidohydrolase YtcJ